MVGLLCYPIREVSVLSQRSSFLPSQARAAGRALVGLALCAAWLLSGCAKTPQHPTGSPSSGVSADPTATAAPAGGLERETLPRRVEPAQAASGPLTYQCEDLRVEAHWHDPRSLMLVLPDRDMWLAQAMAASGVRYASHEGQFWGKGNGEAQLILTGQAPRQCQRTELRSPWAVAREAGIGFRAIGHEPGWVLEVDREDFPAMRIRGLGGEPAWSSTWTTQRPSGWRGVSQPGDGGKGMVAIVHLDYIRCIDAATGYPFGIQVTIHLGDQMMKGCGRFL